MVQVGDYTIEHELARGGVGVVYRGRSGDGRPVAIKVLLTTAASQLQRFRREAQALARLRHPHVVRVLDVGQDADGRPFLVMELIEGRSLEAELARGPLPPARAAELVRQVAGAVAHAHAAGVLHRDLKPANVLIDAQDQAHLTDFGLVKDLAPGDASRLSQTGQFLGTPGYWAPEQAQGQGDQVTVDVFGLGALLYALLSGRPPHQASSLVDALAQAQQAPPPLPPVVPAALQAICLRCMQLDPQVRYPSASAVEAALSAWQTPPPAAPVPWRLVGVVVGLGLAAAAGIVVARRLPGAALPARPPVAEPRDDAVEAARAEVDEAQRRLDRWRPWAECDAPLTRALELDPGQFDALATRARLAAERGDPDAGAGLDQLAERDPEHPQLLLGRIALAREDADAISLCERILARDSLSRPGLCQAAQFLLRAGRREEALVMAERAVAAHPEDAWPWVVRAAAQRDTELAIRDLERADRLDPDHPRLSLARVTWRLQRELHDEALADARRLMAWAPERGEGYLLAGRALLLLDRPAEALELLERGLELRPLPSGYEDQANALRYLNQPERAVEAALRALELAPEHPQSLTTLAMAQIESRRLDDARETVGRFARSDPDGLAVYGLRGSIEELAGDYDAALTAYRELLVKAQLRADERDRFVSAARACRLLQHRLWVDAQADRTVLIVDAFSQIADHRPDLARLSFEGLGRLQGSDAVSEAGIGYCLNRMGREGATHLERALEVAPDSLWVQVLAIHDLLERDPGRRELCDALLAKFPDSGPALRLRAWFTPPQEHASRRADLERAAQEEADPTLALTLWELGYLVRQSDPTRGERLLLRATQLAPTAIPPKAALMDIAARDGRTELSAAIRQELLRVAPDDVSVYMAQAEVELQERDPNRALIMARAATWLTPNHVEPWILRANCLRWLGAHDQARHCLARARSLPGAGRHAERIARLEQSLR